jgi:ABC-type hemin transport system substrate-binding protein
MALRIRDDMHRDLIIARIPRRIVSLVPSDTETLFALGLGDRVVGRTRYCVEPAGRVEHIPVCGGTKDVDVDAVRALTPDLVLGNQEENARAPLEALAQSGLLLFVSFPNRVADGIRHVARLARILGVAREPVALDLVRRGHALLARLHRESAEHPAGQIQADAVPVFLPIWMDPLMTLSGSTFGSDMLTVAGARNVFGERQRLYPLAADLGKADPWDAGKVGARDTRYPRITLDEVAEHAPAAMLLPDEPHAFSAADADSLRAHPGLAEVPVRFVDGKDLFWYGARSLDAVDRLRAVIAELR